MRSGAIWAITLALLVVGAAAAFVGGAVVAPSGLPSWALGLAGGCPALAFVAAAALGLLPRTGSFEPGLRRGPGGLLGPAPAVPARLVARPERYESIKRALLGRKSTAVIGMAGAGKTVLVSLAAHDPEVLATYPDGAIWVSLGQTPNLVAVQAQIANLLGEGIVSFTEAYAGRARLRELLKNRAVLLIVDDVWDRKHLDAVNGIGPDGSLLFSTRDRGIARSILEDTACVEVSRLEPDEARDLLRRWTSREAGAETDGGLVDSIRRAVDDLALGLAIVGAMILRAGGTPEAWRSVMALLDKADPAAIEDRYPPDEYPQGNLMAALETSVGLLAPDQQARFCELAVFAGRGAVPVAAVQALWSGWDFATEDTANLLDELVDRSLAERGDSGWYILHDLLYGVGRTHLGGSGLMAAHHRLVEGYRRLSQTGSWSECPQDGYIFENLAFHLSCCGATQELDSLHSSYEWLQARLSATDVTGLLADFEYGSPSPGGEAVHRALQLSAQTLLVDRSQLAGQLVGRLIGMDDHAVRGLLRTARSLAPRPWLCPRNVALSPPGRLYQVLEGHTDSVTAVAMSPDGRRVVSGSRDRSIRVWELATGECIRTLQASGPTWSVAISLNGRRVVSGASGRVDVWDFGTGKRERILTPDADAVHSVATSSDGRWIVSGGSRALSVWDLVEVKRPRTCEGHVGPVWALDISPDDRWIVTGGEDQSVRVWDLATGKVERTLYGHVGPVNAVTISSDGHWIASGGDRTVRVWELATGKLVRTLEGHMAWVCTVAISRDSRWIVSGGRDDTIRVWDMATGKLEDTLLTHVDWVNSVATSSNSRLIVSGGRDDLIRLWSFVANPPERTVDAHADWVNALAISADRRWAVSGGRDDTVRVWELATGKQVRTLRHEATVEAVATTSSGLVVAVSSSGMTSIWDLATGKRKRWRTGQFGWQQVRLSPDCRWLVGVSYRSVRIWDLTTGRQVRSLDNTDRVNALAVSPDSRWIISGGRDGTIQVWELSTGRLARVVGSHTANINVVTASPDNRLVISCSEDRTLRVWEQATGREVAHWRAEPGTGINACDLAQGGSPLVAYGDTAGRVVVLQLLEESRAKGPVTLDR